MMNNTMVGFFVGSGFSLILAIVFLFTGQYTAYQAVIAFLVGSLCSMITSIVAWHIQEVRRL